MPMNGELKKDECGLHTPEKKNDRTWCFYLMPSLNRLINIIDTASGLETTIKISKVRCPDDENIVWPREKEDIIIHQITGTYHTLEDFNYEWDNPPEPLEKTVLCPKCKDPVTYYTPRLNELVNYISMNKTDARRLINALLGVLQED